LAIARSFEPSLTGLPAVWVFKPFTNEDKGALQESDDTPFTFAALTSFIENQAFPLLSELTPENYKLYIGRGRPVVYLFVDKAAAVTKDVLASVRTVAKEFRDKFTFTFLDGLQFGSYAQQYGIRHAPPALLVKEKIDQQRLGQTMETLFVYPQAEPFAPDNLRTFFAGVVEGTVTPSKKSAEPVNGEGGIIKTVVNSQWDGAVLNAGRDVVLILTAPYCSQCVVAMPKIETAAERLSFKTDLVWYKFDIAENDFGNYPPADIKNLPALVLYPAASKSTPLVYSFPEYNDDEIVKWLKEHASSFRLKRKKSKKEDL